MQIKKFIKLMPESMPLDKIIKDWSKDLVKDSLIFRALFGLKKMSTVN